MKRFIYKDDSTLKDFTYSLRDFYTDTEAFTLVAAEDNFYIGSTLPFNNSYLDVSSANSETSNLSIAIWDGNEFVDVVEVQDGTSVSGATLAQSGNIIFVPEKDKGWSMEDTEDISELSGVTIYDRYWIKLTFSADLTADTALNWIGNIFSNDNALGVEFPDLVRSDVKAAFESGKTNWNDQHQVAAKLIEKDLIAKSKIQNANQILTIEDLELVSVQKVAAIIFGALGDDYTDQFLAAEKEYRARLTKSFPKIDQNNDARVSPVERVVRTGVLYR